MRIPITLAIALSLIGCGNTPGTAPPPDGWANNGPTVVTQAIDRETTQLLFVEQGQLRAWVEVPKVGAVAGDYVLLGQGTARADVTIPELDTRVRQVVDIAHVQVVDEQTARDVVASQAPPDATAIGTVFAELAARDGQPIVVYGTVVKANRAAGSVWIHLQDGTGDEAAETHDLTVQAREAATVGQRVAYRGVLRRDANIGFGYQFTALVEEAERVP